ncbi:hypothetical protein CAK95_17960 [Pseudorhodoplanes sinuspersici]|uniref:HPt domain-containing protein n=1 Tax=Pseudorhodoplanes sinuspersici TaxID=1235591 RepID=A0A1W7A0V9_9HYPH|nr:hypothetical protein CAK95_17960 [Pseudorhodoplanes sinuspersici]
MLAPPIVPAQRPIDLVHLSRMTLDDRALEREVLALFDRQMLLMMERIGSSTPDVAAAAAHTLKGSATGIGAWQVANAAAAVETAAKDGDKFSWQQRVAGLDQAVRDARCGISELLQAG